LLISKVELYLLASAEARASRIKQNGFDRRKTIIKLLKTPFS
jgi:hypothetical protein